MYNRLSETSPEQRDHYSFRQKLIGIAAVFITMTACSQENEPPDPSPLPLTTAPFNHPPAGEYFLDEQDQYYDQLRSTLESTKDPIAKKHIRQLQETPISQWLNTTTESAQQAISENISQSEVENTIPVFVAYDIPQRDLDGEARGGLSNAAEYNEWITAISESIGDTPSIVILEPDALAGVPEMDSIDGQKRISMLRDAMATFQQNNSNTAVYLDVGHSGWLDPEEVVELLHDVDQGREIVSGIALNVSNQRSNQETRAYADTISRLFGRDFKVMIDTSMNGAPNTDKLTEWCNADGEYIGNLEDTAYNPDQKVEEMYIKVPGESDGNCGESNEPAGEFDPELLIKQVT